mgnify:CR=1 FL=1
MADRTNGEITIEADQAKIMDVIADLPAYPDWSDGVEAVEVLETTPEGRPDRARFTFASGPIKDTYVLKYSWHGNDSVDWTLESGGVIKQQDGTYTLVANPDGSVTVTYDLTVELSIPMIGMIRKKAEKMIVKTALQGLKDRVDSL